MRGGRSAGQRLQKFYCLLVSANTYVTPVTNNHLQGTHVFVTDTPALLRGGEQAPLSLPGLPRQPPLPATHPEAQQAVQKGCW